MTSLKLWWFPVTFTFTHSGWWEVEVFSCFDMEQFCMFYSGLVNLSFALLCITLLCRQWTLLIMTMSFPSFAQKSSFISGSPTQLWKLGMPRHSRVCKVKHCSQESFSSLCELKCKWWRYTVEPGEHRRHEDTAILCCTLRAMCGNPIYYYCLIYCYCNTTAWFVFLV